MGCRMSSRLVIEAYINESVNTSLLNRFIQYCKGANITDAYYQEIYGKYYLFEVRPSRLSPLVKSFIKANNDKIIFEINIPKQGPIEVIKLETIFK